MSTDNHTSTKHGLPLLCLTALGVVYGDIGTSPLYALHRVVELGAQIQV